MVFPFAWVLVVPLVLIGAAALGAAETPANQPLGESLGDGLLEGLGPDLFAVPGHEPGGPQPAELVPKKGPSSADGGEDVGPANSPLERVRDGMCQAQQLLAGHDTTEPARPIQVRVVRDLDALIAQLEKQCQSSRESQQRQQVTSRRSQDRVRQPGKPDGKKNSPAGKGASAAQDSTARINDGEVESVDTPDWQQLLKDLWGHLPERVREQLSQAPTDEFLPKYKLEIEKYFRRLAEDRENGDGR